MSLLKLRTAPFVLIIDDTRKNIVPLLLDLTQNEQNVSLVCTEQPAASWRNVFNKSNLTCHTDVSDFIEKSNKINGTIIIDSITQMVLVLGWRESLKYLIQMKKSENIKQIIVVLHKDCVSHSSVMESQLRHIASGIIAYSPEQQTKVSIHIKKSGKISKTEETLSYDIVNKVLKSTQIVKESKKTEDEPERPSPASLSTFKIEVEQTSQLEKHNLKLPYMNKIHGESKVIYEPDAVDDWDEEDPDDDLDI